MHSSCFLPTDRNSHPLPPQGPGGTCVPASTYYEVLRRLRPSRRTRCLRWRYHSLRLSSSLPRGRRRLGPGAFGSATPRTCRMETAGPPVPGKPCVPMPCSLTPADWNASGHYDASAWPPFAARRRLLARGNFGAESHAWARAVTLRRGSPHRTQNSLLVAGQALPGGTGYRRVSTKGFRSIVHSSPFPSFLAQAASIWFSLISIS